MSNREIARTMIEAAVSLKRAAPEAWDKFLEALNQHSDGLKNDCVSSPADGLQVAQGRAQAILGLHTQLAKAHLTADKIEQRMREKPHDRPYASGWNA